MSKIIILAEFKVVEDKIDECRKLFNELAWKSANEKGCLNYEVFQVSRDEQWFIIAETFQDKEAQEFHKTTKHYLEILKGQLEPMIIEKKVRFLL